MNEYTKMLHDVRQGRGVLMKEGYLSLATAVNDLIAKFHTVVQERDNLKAEAVPVVRCGIPADGHCKHYDHGYCPLLKIRMDPCDFCSYGCREKTGNETD